MEQYLPGLETRSYIRYDGAGRQALEGYLPIEEPLQVMIDGQAVAVLMRTPGNEKELAVGFCVSEGLLDSFADVGLVQHCGRLGLENEASQDDLDISRNVVTIMTARGQKADHDPRHDVLRLVRSGCGRTDSAELAGALKGVESSLQIPRAVVTQLTQRILAGQQAYREAGGVHAVAIFDAAGRQVILGEDIGRHNAVDKAIGHCLLRGIPLHDKILYSTGRASYEMVLKSIRVGLPIAISRSSPTTLAIDLAEQLNGTLIGYARSDRMSIYTHPERIVD